MIHTDDECGGVPLSIDPSMRDESTYVTEDVITFSDVGCSLHVVYELIKPPEQCSINGVTSVWPARLHGLVTTCMFITIIILLFLLRGFEIQFQFIR